MQKIKLLALLLAVVASAACGGDDPLAGGTDAGIDSDVDIDAGDAGPVCTVADEPDPNAVDSNCDGIDGVESDAIFVSANTGNDSNAGTKAAPVATIAVAQNRAQSNGKHQVLLATGTYTERVTLVGGISIHGGYSASTWSRSLASLDSIITFSPSPVIYAEGVIIPTRLSGLRVLAITAAADASSIAVQLVNSAFITIENCTLRTGNGGDGSDGVGPSVFPLPGMAGLDGWPARCSGMDCIFPYPTYNGGRPGAAAVASCGAGGTSPDQGGTNPDRTVFVLGGYAGGSGSFIDATGACVSNATGSASSAGGAARDWDQAGVQYGFNGVRGADGTDGAPGGPGDWAGGFSMVGFSPITGGSGIAGRPGGGGGSGGNAANYFCPDNRNFLIGATGGSGGSGGAGGGGGTGAKGGGASIPLYLWQTVPTLHDVQLVRGNGGVGGDGGQGLAGAVGGGASVGMWDVTVICPDTGYIGAFGGSGGAGGQGGHGGRGGGGSGGPSFGIFFGTQALLHPDSSGVVVDVGFGQAGMGGAGGEVGTDGVVCASYSSDTQYCVPTLP